MANRRDYSVTIPGQLRSINPFNGPNGTVQPMSSSRTAFRSATDYSRKRSVRSGWIKPTPYSMQEEVDIRPNGEVLSYGLYGVSGLYGTVENGAHYGTFITGFNKLGITPGFPSDLANKALTKARLKVKSQDINLAQAFGERAQTAGLVAENLKAVAEMYRAFRHGNVNAIRRYFGRPVRSWRKDFLNRWLEFQYGVKPLLSDIHGAVTALDETPYDRYMVTVKASSSVNQSGRVDHHQADSNAAVGGHYRLVVEARHSSRVRIDVCPASGALATAASLGFTNPLSLAWELLPFSFVVDWAYPLGDYFSQFDALAGWEVKGFSQSNLTKISSEVTGLNFTKTDGYPTTQKWVGKWRKVQLNRSAGTSVPFATLPSVKNPISTTHLMNALALLTSATRL